MPKMAVFAPMASPRHTMATDVKPGLLRSVRSAYRTSATSSSMRCAARTSRHCCLTWSNPPNCARALRRASARSFPSGGSRRPGARRGRVLGIQLRLETPPAEEIPLHQFMARLLRRFAGSALPMVLRQPPPTGALLMQVRAALPGQVKELGLGLCLSPSIRQPDNHGSPIDAALDTPCPAERERHVETSAAVVARSRIRGADRARRLSGPK